MEEPMEKVSGKLRQIFGAAYNSEPFVVDGKVDPAPKDVLSVLPTGPDSEPLALSFPLDTASLSHLLTARNLVTRTPGLFHLPPSRVQLTADFRTAVRELGKKCAYDLGLDMPYARKARVELVGLMLQEPVTFTRQEASMAGQRSLDAVQIGRMKDFARLFVHLPSAFSGGMLIVTKDSQISVTCDMSSGMEAYPRFAAVRTWGVKSEFEGVQSGRRVYLEFAIICHSDRWAVRDPPLPVPQALVEALKRTVQLWDRIIPDHEVPVLHINHMMLLDTVPGKEGMTIDGLEGSDVQIVELIMKSNCLGFGVAALERENGKGKRDRVGSDENVDILPIKKDRMLVSGYYYKVVSWVVHDSESPDIDVKNFCELQEICLRYDYRQYSKLDRRDRDPRDPNWDEPYRLALLVVWPRTARDLMRCENDLPSAVNKCISLLDAGSHEESLEQLGHLVRYVQHCKIVSYEDRIIIFDLVVRMKKIRLLGPMLDLLGAPQYLKINRSSMCLKERFSREGVREEIRSSKAADTLKELAITMLKHSLPRRNGVASIEQGIVNVIENTPSRRLQYLAEFVEQMEKALPAVEYTHIPAITLLLDAAKRISAKHIDIATAACHPTVMQIAEKVEPEIGNELETKISSFYTPQAESSDNAYKDFSIELTQLAQRCVRVGGRISWCVLLKYPQALAATMLLPSTTVEGARTVWAGLLEWLEGTLNNGSEDAVEKAQECANLLLSNSMNCDRFTELLAMMCSAEFRIQAKNGPAVDIVLRATEKRIKVLEMFEEPVNTWRFPSPSANAPEALSQFMRSTERKLQIYNWGNGTRENRSHASNITVNISGGRHCGPNLWEFSGIREGASSSSPRDTFSIMARGGGRGRDAFVEIVKTKDAFEEKLAQFKKAASELSLLRDWHISSQLHD